MTIKELRAKLNLSQSQFGGIIGVDRSDLGKMENGKKKIPDHIINKIWAEFGVEVTDVPEQKPVKRANTPNLEIYIQSPMGGNITPEEVAAKMPEGTECCFVRVDQNLIWWVRGEETGAVEIWPSDDRA